MSEANGNSLDAVVRLSYSLPWKEFCAKMEQEFPPLHQFMETWGPHCGAPRSVILGHLCAMLRDISKANNRIGG